MVYRPHVDEKLCFVLMPFREPFNSYYAQIIRPAMRDLGLDTLRSDEIYGTKPIIRDIWEHIWKARVVIADVTDKNPNVNYELGLCHTLGVPTIIISKREEDVPFDYRHIRCIIYTTEEAGWDDSLRDKLKKTISTISNDSQTSSELPWPYDTSLLKYSPSPSSSLITSDDPQGIVIRGAKLVCEAIRGAFGPHGTYVASFGAVGGAQPCYRGSHIAQTIRSANFLEERGIEQMRLVTSEVWGSAGDGTKLAVLLAQTLLEQGHSVLSEGHSAREVVEAWKEQWSGWLAFLALSLDRRLAPIL